MSSGRQIANARLVADKNCGVLVVGLGEFPVCLAIEARLS
jgi:hypothetical protein